MNEEGPKAGARTLQERWKGRLARQWFDAPPGIASSHWHLFCAHVEQGQSLEELRGFNASTYPTVDALRAVLDAVEARLVAGDATAAAVVAGPAPAAPAAGERAAKG